MIVKTEKWVSDGTALCRIEGKVCFVENALPGEEVKIKITQNRKDYSRAHVLQVIKSSPYRVQPFCPHYEICGGCSMQHISAEGQKMARQEIINDMFQRIARTPLPEDWTLVTGPDRGYRYRAKFHSDGHGNWGFKAPKSNRIHSIPYCPILAEPLEKFPALLKKQRIRSPHCQTLANPLGDIVHSLGNANLPNCKDFHIKVKHREFYADAKVFFQSNLDLLPDLIDFALQGLEGGVAIDLYSGIGLFSAFLEEKFEKVWAVEQNHRCLEFSRENTSDRVEAITADAITWMKDLKIHPDLLLVDPPRTGLEGDIIESIVKVEPSRLVYVSCNPATQARDVKKFAEKGYKIVEARGFDFYPQTPHIEMVLHLVKM